MLEAVFHSTVFYQQNAHWPENFTVIGIPAVHFVTNRAGLVDVLVFASTLAVETVRLCVSFSAVSIASVKAETISDRQVRNDRDLAMYAHHHKIGNSRGTRDHLCGEDCKET